MNIYEELIKIQNKLTVCILMNKETYKQIAEDKDEIEDLTRRNVYMFECNYIPVGEIIILKDERIKEILLTHAMDTCMNKI